MLMKFYDCCFEAFNKHKRILSKEEVKDKKINLTNSYKIYHVFLNFLNDK